jgi:hypothetical protein
VCVIAGLIAGLAMKVILGKDSDRVDLGEDVSKISYQSFGFEVSDSQFVDRGQSMDVT